MKRTVEDSERTFKRVNSKEEILDDDNDNEIQSPPGRRTHPNIAQLQAEHRIRTFNSQRFNQLSLSLMDQNKRKKAVEVMEKTFSAESLKCMLAILDWEISEEGETKDNAAIDIIDVFIKSDDNCLPDTLRKRLVKESGKELEEGLFELKRLLLNDLRFNSTLLSALQM